MESPPPLNTGFLPTARQQKNQQANMPTDYGPRTLAALTAHSRVQFHVSF